MKTLKKYKEEQMQNKEFAKEYKEMQPELDIIKAIVEARTSQNLTQKELAERTGINQADISKLENGTRVDRRQRQMCIRDRSELVLIKQI